MAGFLSIVKSSDYAVSTWLLLGASLQCVLFATLPRNVSWLPPITFIAYRILHGYLVAIGQLSNPVANDVVHGRQTWQVPSTVDNKSASSSSETVVVLVLAASWSHPNGIFSPGSAKMGDYFGKMWADAGKNRDKYGFLGNTPGLTTNATGSRPDEQGTTTLFLSYWKSLEGLHKFAHAEVHMKGQLWWEKGAMNEFPHIGIMHETYEVPAGNWENVSHNFRPFGISNAQYPVSNTIADEGSDETKKPVEWVSGLRPVDRKDWKTMLGRMGRRAGTRNSIIEHSD